MPNRLSGTLINMFLYAGKADVLITSRFLTPGNECTILVKSRYPELVIVSLFLLVNLTYMVSYALYCYGSEVETFCRDEILYVSRVQGNQTQYSSSYRD